MTTWDDLNARARGLGTHLLGRQCLESLTRAPDLEAIADELQRRGYLMEESARTSATALELAARRMTAARLATLSRWAGRRSQLLAVVFQDEDRRSVSALVRGAVQRAPADQRLSGLIPTPELPERALEELARQPTAGAVVALLAAWRHPLGPAAVTAAGGAEPDLLGLETAIARAYARRALDGARRSGRRGLLFRYVRQLIDIQNAYTALVLAGEEERPRASEHWVDGGSGVTAAMFDGAIASRDPVRAGQLVATGLASNRLRSVFENAAEQPAGLERAVLKAMIADLAEESRLKPLSPAPLLSYALRLRAEALDVRRLIWGVSLGAPSATLAEGLATAT